MQNIYIYIYIYIYIDTHSLFIKKFIQNIIIIMKNTNSIKKYYILKAVVDGISQITGLSCSILTKSDF